METVSSGEDGSDEEELDWALRLVAVKSDEISGFVFRVTSPVEQDGEEFRKGGMGLSSVRGSPGNLGIGDNHREGQELACDLLLSTEKPLLPDWRLDIEPLLNKKYYWV
jgi:hypothetical protein